MSNVQDEATALKVPIRFLHQLRALLVQPDTDTTDKTAGQLVQEPFADEPEPAASSDILADSSFDAGAIATEEETDLQAALLAAPQALASIQGSFLEATLLISLPPRAHDCMLALSTSHISRCQQHSATWSYLHDILCMLQSPYNVYLQMFK